MSVYPPPIAFQTIYNPENYLTYDDELTLGEANNTYLIKIGADTDIGPLTCNNQVISTYFTTTTDGSATTPAYARSGGGGLGMFFSANQINWSVLGVQRMNLTNTKLTSTVPIAIPSGSTSNCGIQSSSAANTGLNLTSTNLYLVNSGSNVANWTTAYFTTYLPIKAPNGSATACAYQFTNEQGMGLFYEAVNTMGMAVNGTQYLRLTTGGLTFLNSGITGATPTPLNYFEEYSYSTTFGFVGFNQTPAQTLKIQRIGNMCYLYCPSWSAAVTNNAGAAALCITGSQMAARFIPPNGVSSFAMGYASGAANIVWLFVNTIGNILVYKSTATGSNSTWANGESVKSEGFCIHWSMT